MSLVSDNISYTKWIVSIIPKLKFFKVEGYKVQFTLDSQIQLECTDGLERGRSRINSSPIGNKNDRRRRRVSRRQKDVNYLSQHLELLSKTLQSQCDVDFIPLHNLLQGPNSFAVSAQWHLLYTNEIVTIIHVCVCVSFALVNLELCFSLVLFW